MIPVCKPYWGAEEEEAALRVMRSGRLICGPEVAKFEQMIAEFVGVQYAVACSSGTTALHLALMAMGVGPGDEVLVPAFTFVATANAVLMCGAKPLLTEISLQTFNTLPKQEITRLKVSKAAISVHAFGFPSKYFSSAEIPVLEDAACALGSEGVGHFGHAAIFSFHATKTITTGEGGMVVTNDQEIAEKVRFYRDQKHGLGLAYNYRMTEIQGAIGQEQMKKLPWILERRKDIASRYDLCFGDHQIRARIPPRGGNYQSYVLLLDAGIDRSRAIRELADRGIESLPGTQFLGDMPHLKTEGLPNARAAGERTLRIPMFPQMTDDEFALVHVKVKEVLG